MSGCRLCGATAPACDGSGFGAGRPCPGLVALRLRSAQIPPRYADVSFASLSIDVGGGPILARHRDVCRRFVAATVGREPDAGDPQVRFAPGVPSLLLSGPCGTGKTHLACATLRACAEATGARVRYVDTISLFAALGDAVAAKRSSGEIMEPLLTADVLVLDELAARSMGAYSASALYLVVSERYNYLLPTVFVTALPWPALAAAVGSSIASRLYTAETLDFTGIADYRLAHRAPARG